MRGDKWMLLCVIILTMSTSVSAQNITATKQLMTDLFSNYNRKVRPIFNQSQAVDVKVGYTLYSLNEVDDIGESMTTTCFLTLEWTDEELMWTPSDYDNITMLSLPQIDIWHPDLTLRNGIGKAEMMGDESLLVYVENTGTIKWYPFERFKSSCSINVKYYPFDEQICEQVFSAWSYSTSEVTFSPNDDVVNLDEYTESATWAILDTKAESMPNQYEPTMKFTFHLKRKPLFTILNMLLPIVFLAVLALLVFVLPVESGEKVGYAVTVFLAFAVFLTIIQDIMPNNSESVALLNLLITLLTAFSAVICAFAILITKVSFMKDLHVPKFFVFLSMIGTFDFKRLCKKRSKPKRSKVANLTLSDQEAAEYGVKKNNPPRTISSASSHSSNSSDAEEEKPTWSGIMHGLEMFCLMFWTLLFILITLVIIIGSYTNSV